MLQTKECVLIQEHMYVRTYVCTYILPTSSAFQQGVHSYVPTMCQPKVCAIYVHTYCLRKYVRTYVRMHAGYYQAFCLQMCVKHIYVHTTNQQYILTRSMYVRMYQIEVCAMYVCTTWVTTKHFAFCLHMCV